MRIACGQPGCRKLSPEIRWWDWFLTGLLFGFDWRFWLCEEHRYDDADWFLTGLLFGFDWGFWLCEEHRYDDADWDELERELRRFGKLGSP